MGQGSGVEDLGTRTLDLGSGLLGGFGEDVRHPSMGTPECRGLKRIRKEYVQGYKELNGLFGINSHCAL